ncbi:MAG: NAD(P)H-hydrate dehydratase [Coriobacteriia bacterium]|nr:NAD(P)H-hydrate dehydratase [Coriobacteriia bacterium]
MSKKTKKISYSKKALKNLLFFPSNDANKYSRGTCNIVAGSESYPGAAVLAALAASKSGSGYTRLFTDNSVKPIAISLMPSLVVSSFEDLSVEKFDAEKPSAYLVGPGFADLPGEQKIILKVLEGTDAPVILDGGALRSFSIEDVRDAVEERYNNGYDTVLTPHMGEAKNLLFNYAVKKITSQESHAKDLAYFTKATIVLKGPNTFVCDDKQIYEMKSGTASLAKAGSGDVLAGILAGIMCQNRLSAFNACVLATNLHAQAGNLAAKDLTEISVTPEDLINYIPKSIKYF